MSLIEDATRKLDVEKLSVKQSFIPISKVVEHLKATAENFADVFLQEEKSLQECITHVENKLQFLALKNCLETKEYSVNSQVVGTSFNVEDAEIFQLAEIYYFLPDDELNLPEEKTQYEEMLSKLREEVTRNSNANTEKRVKNAVENKTTTNLTELEKAAIDIKHKQLSLL